MPCPENIETLAEAYLMERLSLEERDAWEEHYVGCPLCAERLQNSAKFSAAIPHAARLKGSLKTLFFREQALCQCGHTHGEHLTFRPPVRVPLWRPGACVVCPCRGFVPDVEPQPA